MSDEKKLHSYHIFMFPFKWNYKGNNKSLYEMDFEKRVNVDIFEYLLSNDWIPQQPKLTCEVEDFNEYVYFHNYARPAIYGLDGDTSYSASFVYEFKSKKTGEFIIVLNDGTEYELQIDTIKLKVYKTGVAILSYHLANHKYPSSEDILKINDFGRRVYPQFLKKSEVAIPYIEKAQENFLPKEVRLKLNGDSDVVVEDYTHFNDLPSIQENPTKVTRIITDLLGERFVNGLQESVSVKKIHIEPIIDDRMFVLSWYGNGGLSEVIKNYDEEKEEYDYCRNDFWYKYLFMDGGSRTCQSKVMMKTALLDSTYDRWVDYGTIFGLSSYSFVLLSNQTDFSINGLVPHMKTMYYELAALSLAQRASILRFSEEVSFVSQVQGSRFTQRVRELYKHYINFVNKMVFNEVSSQEQGIELYDLLQKKMRNPQGVEALEKEIGELHQYASLDEERKSSEALNTLTILGALFVIPSFITGFFGMNLNSIIDLFDKSITPNIFGEGYTLLWKWLSSYVSLPGLVLVGLFYLYRKLSHIKIVRIILKSILLIILGVPIILFLAMKFL